MEKRPNPVPDSMPLDMLDRLFECAYAVDADRRIVYWNKAAEALTGYPAGTVLGTKCSDNILVHVDKDGRPLCTNNCPLSDSMQSLCRNEATVYLQHAHGHRVLVNIRTVPTVEGDGSVWGLELFEEAGEVADMRSRMADLERLALLDALTGAGNRRLADLAMHSRHSALLRLGSGYSVAMIDLDNLKLMNDEFGHDAGDLALKSSARSMLNTLRASDILSRWGGDEFLLVLEGADLDEAMKAMERMRALVESSSVEVGEGIRIGLTVSAGVTQARPSETADEVVTRADRLLYDAKRAGRNRIAAG